MLLRVFVLTLALNLLAACTAYEDGAQEETAAIFLIPTVAPAPAGTAVPTLPAPQMPTPIPTATVGTLAEAGEPVFVGPDDPHLRYIGRFDFQDPQRPAFDWSGSSIETGFTGTSVTILLSDGANYYNVTIDGETTILQTLPGESRYEGASGLAQGEHTLRLTKRTEAYVGAAVFEGLLLDAGAELVKGPPAPGRRLEFVGDSITAGYGIEGDSPECYFTPGTQNAARTYAAQTAEALGADYTLLALSGLGVVRNLREAEAASPETAVAYIDRTLGMNSFVRYPPGDAPPDAVVINLGTNDFSSLPFPDDEAFVTAYQELLAELRGRYAAAQIVAVAGPLMQGRAPQLIAQAVERQRTVADDEAVRFLEIEDTLERSAVDFGCDWHPNVAGHEKMAAQLIPALAEILGW
jgi:lysophospholipase L1-like esterase